MKLFWVVFIYGVLLTQTYAQSSLGIGNSEEAIVPSTGFFGSFFNWIATEQREFYRSMTDALRDMRKDGSAVWLLAGLSFLYGILHAAGPGHGKVVISSYMLANETELKRGVALSFISSALQAVSAIVIVGLGFLILRGTAITVTAASQWIEILSYIMIIAFGIWLLMRKLKNIRARATHSHNHGHDHSHHHHGEDDVCSTCGHAHMPTPKELSGDMDIRGALAAVLAVGIRPCSGAVIVLSFALLNGLYLGGIVSVFAMALGTAITVSSLATISVVAKNTAIKFSTSAIMNARLHNGIELFGAGLLIMLGSILLAANLSV